MADKSWDVLGAEGKLVIDSITKDGKTIHLAMPYFFVDVVRKNSFWYATNVDLGIDVMGSNLMELRGDLIDEIFMLWDNYALAPDETLSPFALELKRRWLSAAREVKND